MRSHFPFLRLCAAMLFFLPQPASAAMFGPDAATQVSDTSRHDSIAVPSEVAVSESLFGGESPAMSRMVRPPVEAGRTIGQLAAGVAGGTLLYLVGREIGEVKTPVEQRRIYIHENGVSAAMLGYVIGSAVGVFVIGDNQHETGSLYATFAGSALGSLIGAMSAVLLNRDDSSAGKEWATALGVAIGAPVGATTAFIFSRRYRAGGTTAPAFFNMSKGQANFGLPMPQVHLDPTDGKPAGAAVPILHVTF